MPTHIRFALAIPIWLGISTVCVGQAITPKRTFRETIHQGAVYGVVFTPDDRQICSCGNDKRVVVTEIREIPLTEAQIGQRKQWLKDLDSDAFAVRQRGYRNLLSCGPSLVPRLKKHLADLESREARARVRSLLRQFTAEPQTIHKREIRGIAVCPDGRNLWTVARDNTLCRWSLPAGQPQQLITAHTDGVWSVACSGNNRWLASGGGDYMVQLWNAQTGQKLSRLAGHQTIVHGVAFSPDSRWLASAGGFDRTIRIWNPATAELVKNIDDTREAILRVIFLPDNKRLVSAGYGNEVVFHRTDKWQPVAQLETGIAVVRGLAVSSDGKHLAVGGNHSSIEIWNTETFERETKLTGFTGNVGSLAFAHQQNQLAAGDSEGNVAVWEFQ